MQAVTTIGLDIAKSVFQIHGVDAAGNVIVHRQLKRRYFLPFFQKLPPCLIGIEACASSHHWSRELKALGHTVRLNPTAPPVELDIPMLIFGNTPHESRVRPIVAMLYCN
jgi:transposase